MTIFRNQKFLSDFGQNAKCM